MTETLSPEKIREEAQAIADQVDAVPFDQKSRVFFDAARASVIPYMPCYLGDQAGELYARSYEAFFLLGRASIPLTVGLIMHQYNLAALATMPVPQEPEFERRRKILVDTIRKYKSILAISSFGENIKNKQDPSRNVLVEIRPDGVLVCRGRKAFQSMASEADLLLFSGVVGEGTMGMFWTSLKDQTAMVKGPSLFPGTMALTDTRPIQFNDLLLKQRNILSLTDHLTDHISFYATAWFEALVTAAYLGGASRALDEVRKFGHSVHVEDDELLSDVDGFVVDCGRLSILLRSSLAHARTFGYCADRYCTLMRQGASPEELDGVADDLMDCGSAIKYMGTQNAATIVNGARRLIGTRSMNPGHPISYLSEQILFGPLHPQIPAHYERLAGNEMLGDEPYLGYYGWALR